MYFRYYVCGDFDFVGLFEKIWYVEKGRSGVMNLL